MAQNPPTQFQRIITALAASILVFYLWMFVYQKFWAPPPQARTQPAPAATAPAELPAPARTTAPATAPAVERPETVPAITRPAGEGRHLEVEGGTDAQTVMLGNAEKDSVYPMALKISPEGASIQDAWVRGYYETVEKKQPYLIMQPLKVEPAGPDRFSLTTAKIRFLDLDQEVPLDSVLWKKLEVTDQQVVFGVTVHTQAGEPVARVLKTYRLPPQPPKKGSIVETFNMLLSIRIENLTDHALRAVLVQQGPIGFQRAAVRQEDRAIIVATYQEGHEGVKAKAHYRKELKDKQLVDLTPTEEGQSLAWMAEANQYFTCIMTPVAGPTGPVKFERVDAIRLTERPTYDEDLTFRLVTRSLPIAPGQSKDVDFDCYIGPKSKRIFESVPQYEKLDYYAVITTSFYFCAPTGLTSFMMWLLNFFHRIPPHNYGISIFLLVLVVRLILHPITKKSQVNMMKMQKQMASLQPKINAVKEKYGNDRQAMNQAMMEVYREAGVNPAGSVLTCIPMALQLPIWAALWAALNSTVEMRHAPLDGWWIKDLTQPDALIPLGTAIHVPLLSFILGGPITAINLLPILLAISQLLQAKYMPRSTAPSTPDKPDQMEQQRKMMMFMSVFFFFMFYNMPSGLNLYIMTSNVAGIFEQWRIRQHIAEEEKRGKFAAAAAPKPKGWLHRKWEELQKEADQARRVHSDRTKKRR